MRVVKDSTIERNERQKGWREESQVGMESASSGDRIVSVAYPGILFRGGGVSTNLLEDRGQRAGIWGR